MISITPPFVLRLSKDERRVFQQNHNLNNLLRREVKVLSDLSFLLNFYFPAFATHGSRWTDGTLKNWQSLTPDILLSALLGHDFCTLFRRRSVARRETDSILAMIPSS